MKRKTIPDDKQLFIFDMDGTIYLGENVFDCAVSFIRRLRENGEKNSLFHQQRLKCTRILPEKTGTHGL